MKLPNEEATKEFNRLIRIAFVGLGILVIAILAGVLLSRRLSRNITRFTDAALALSRLDLADVPRLPPSRFRELDSAGAAFNTMTDALRWFETYQPVD